MFKQIIAAFLALCAATAMAAVDVNKADQAALESVKGIGPSLSTKLMAERKKGDFKDWNDLIDRVGGVGPGNAAKFSTAGLTVNSATYSAAPTDAKAMKTKADKPIAGDKASKDPKATKAAPKVTGATDATTK